MIRCEKLCFSYTGTPPEVLRGIDLEVREGDYISVVGENGSGKSTLMRLMLRFLRPTSGSIQNTFARIGYVPQKKEFAGSGFPITVYETLYSYQRLLGGRSRARVMQALGQVGMASFTKSLLSNLSGGQIQKVLLARALLGQPDLLVLDEPSTGVDRRSQREIYAFLRSLNREHGLTIVSVEHNLEAAIANSTRIYHIREGRGHICSVEQYASEVVRENEEEE